MTPRYMHLVRLLASRLRQDMTPHLTRPSAQ